MSRADEGLQHGDADAAQVVSPPPELGRIQVILTRGDGGEEGNEWKFSGTDDALYDLFEVLCQIIIGYPFVVKPEDEETGAMRGPE